MLLKQAIQSFRDYIKMIDRSQSTITCYMQELVILTIFFK